MYKPAAKIAPPKIQELPSPNFDARPEGEKISTLVIHYTGMKTVEAAKARLCDPEAKVSSHYLIDRKGTVFQLVQDRARAWHAGHSFWDGKDMVNNRSIGIELENTGHEFGYVPFTQEQMDSLHALARDLMARHPIEPKNVVGHSDVAPERKEDPGELFDWEWLARRGVGLWPELPVMSPEPLFKKGDSGVGVLSMQERLRDYGYNINVSGHFDEHTESVVRAFQRHFGGSESNLDGAWDSRLDEMLSALINMCD